MIVRGATSNDAAAVDAVNRAAFPTDDEARLVAALVSDGDALLSLVADDAGAIVGHAMFSQMAVEADGVSIAAAGLAPVAVLPRCQRQGVGSRLVRAGLDALVGVRIVFVLGDPRYYRRFGFDAAAAAPFAGPYAGPHLMARWLGQPMHVGTGRADYAPAFAAMDAA